MGVYAAVSMCIVTDAPLPIDTRIAIIDLAIEHQLIAHECEVAVPSVRQPYGVVEKVKYLFGWREQIMSAIESGAPGPWIAARMREANGRGKYEVRCESPAWKGEPITGPFVYRAFVEPQEVKVVDAYRQRGARSPHAPSNDVDRFYDVMTLDAKRGVDGRSMASSPFIKAVKALTGMKVLCRTGRY